MKPEYAAAAKIVNTENKVGSVKVAQNWNCYLNCMS